LYVRETRAAESSTGEIGVPQICTLEQGVRKVGVAQVLRAKIGTAFILLGAYACGASSRLVCPRLLGRVEYPCCQSDEADDQDENFQHTDRACEHADRTFANAHRGIL